MATYQRGKYWWYRFRFAGERIDEPTKSTSRTVAKDAERQHRKTLEAGYNNFKEVRQNRVRILEEIIDEYLTGYRLRYTLPCTNPSDGREGRDRESLNTPEEQLVKQVYEVNKKTVVILVSSFPLAINWTEENVPAILHMAHSSQDEGTALAQVLFGDYNPGGHLVETWPKSLDQLPPMMDYNIRDGKTYMYFKGDPLYPFGFGLSYTSFKYSNLKSSAAVVAKDGSVTVSVDVTNTGSRAGDAVVQLYVKHMQSKVVRPREELKGFQRVTILPNETKTVQIPLKASALAYWDQKRQEFQVESEPVQVMVGNSSADLPLSTTVHVQ